MAHIVLLGDSVFDNRADVKAGGDVIAHVSRIMPYGWMATLLARDSSVIADIADQLRDLPVGATHLVVSVGGNDALRRAYLVDARAPSVSRSLMLVSTAAEEIRSDYVKMMEAVLTVGLSTAVCTIYEPHYPEPMIRQAASAALAIINDTILREAGLRGIPVLDLRLICNEDNDFTDSIELSAQGGAKIASAIVDLVAQHDFSRQRCEVYPRSRPR
jgi:lysophospholipase L1-like esterase